MSYRIPDEQERARYGQIASHAFAFPVEEHADWFARAGHEHLRVIGERVAGGLVVIPQGQFFGGRSVPSLGIAGVAVATEARGAGVATALMNEVVHEARANGFALSALYPATVQLYARSGYARAGARHEISVAPTVVRTGARGPLERVDDPENDAELRALYARFAALRNGFLDRGPYVWGRVFRPRKAATDVFKLMGPDGAVGYLAVGHGQGDEGTKVTVRDFVVFDRDGAARALEALSAYGSVAEEIHWYGAAPDLLTAALPERRHEIRTGDYWMLRVCDVEQALSMRGYSPLLDLTLDLEVFDDVIAENAGRFVVRVRDGHATVERGGAGALRLDVRALASLYSGFHDATTLVALGLAEGAEGELDKADALFAGRAPAMADYF